MGQSPGNSQVAREMRERAARFRHLAVGFRSDVADAILAAAAELEDQAAVVDDARPLRPNHDM